MKMGAGGEPGRADIADGVAGPDAHADGNALVEAAICA